MEKMQRALRAGELAGLEKPELDAYEQAIEAAKVQHALEKAARCEAEAAAEEEAMKIKHNEKQEAAQAAAKRRSYSSYFFGDSEFEAKDREAEEAHLELQASQQRRRKSQASLLEAQSQLEALTSSMAKELASEATHTDPTMQGA